MTIVIGIFVGGLLVMGIVAISAMFSDEIIEIIRALKEKK